ncbi:MAG TPA: hypothetical protein VIS06_16550 [Mycobacteriales bacterium]
MHRICREQNLGSRGLSERSWKHWEAGEHPGPDYQDLLLARLFQTSPVRLGFARDYNPATDPEPEPTPSTNPPGDPRQAVDPVERRLAMAADESARLGDNPGTVGPLTLDQLRSDAQTIAGRFASAPRLELFESALLLRDRVFTHLDGRQRVSDSRELYLLAGVALGMLAEVNDDLGHRTAASRATRRRKASATPSDSRRRSICRPSVARLSCRGVRLICSSLTLSVDQVACAMLERGSAGEKRWTRRLRASYLRPGLTPTRLTR